MPAQPPTVALAHCPDYSPAQVQRAVADLFTGLGGLERFVRPGARVFCKVNLLIPARPEQAITTHPEVVRAVVREVKRVGGVPVVGDNPALAVQGAALRLSGIAAVLAEEGVATASLGPTTHLAYPEGAVFKSFALSQAILDCDVLLNLPKLKTHALVGMTLAMKNLFGLVPGLEKARWHFRAQTAASFAMLLADLYVAVQGHFQAPGRALLHLCDGILALEGDGPSTGGRPKPLGVLLASADGVALDRTVCQVIGLDPARLPALAEGVRRGLGEGDLTRLELTGEPLDRWAGTTFLPATGGAPSNSLMLGVTRSRLLRDWLVDRPVIDLTRCTTCGRCSEICPAQTIVRRGTLRLPWIGLRACIRCYCCAEVCPAGAIRKSRQPLLGRLVGAG